MLSSMFIVIIVALIFDFTNGFHGPSSSIITSVSTRVLSPRQAVFMATALNFMGALFSVNVARTFIESLTSVTMNEYILIAALTSSILWNVVLLYFEIPGSTTQALIGAPIGATMAFSGNFNIFVWKSVFYKIIIPLLISPIIGFILGYIFMELLCFSLQCFSQRFVNTHLPKLQIFSAAFLAFSHRSNNAQKTIGIITIALLNAKLLA